MSEPFELTVAEAADRIRRRRLSAVELMESLLARARSLEPDLRVWVTLDEDAALAEARRRQDELDESGPAGPLHGVPVGVKDIFYTAGVRTTSGSPIYADFVPTYDATAVAVLKASGAVIMGKTVTTEFACMDPSPTRNPWNVAHTPGGSSSGSAVGVAARAFPAALGSQTAGSVLRPAAYSGVVGMKPTFGSVSTHGVTPVAGSLDTVGFFTRTVRDAATVLSVLAGHNPSDHSSSPAVRADYSAVLDPDLMPPHIGLVGAAVSRSSRPRGARAYGRRRPEACACGRESRRDRAPSGLRRRAGRSWHDHGCRSGVGPRGHVQGAGRRLRAQSARSDRDWNGHSGCDVRTLAARAAKVSTGRREGDR